MAVGTDMRHFVEKFKAIKKYTDNQTKQNVKDACYEMVARAKERTPPHEGEERGVNTVTGNMARHWDSSYYVNGDDIKVRLYNNVQYASYVENGHKMDRHFVQWLYIDGTGTIARHQPNPGEPLFGLVVGTKTTYVEPEHIVDQAKERFYEAYSVMRNDMINNVKRMIDE
jgi:hypothetical protein